MVSLHYTLTGPATAPVVLFLHGFMGSSNDWAHALDDLDDTFRCVAVDLPGHGASTHHPDPAAYTMEGAAQELIAVLDDLDAKQPAVVSYSMGGRLALYFAVHHPARCRRLVLESASPGLRSPSEREARRAEDEARARRLETGDFEQFLNAWYRQPLFASLSHHEGLVEEMVATRLRNDPDELARSVHGMSPGRQPCLWERLADLPVFTLALAGACDEKYAAMVRQLDAASSQQLQATVVPDAGHNIHTERPDTYLNIVRDFLTQPQ